MKKIFKSVASNHSQSENEEIKKYLEAKEAKKKKKLEEASAPPIKTPAILKILSNDSSGISLFASHISRYCSIPSLLFFRRTCHLAKESVSQTPILTLRYSPPDSIEKEVSMSEKRLSKRRFRDDRYNLSKLCVVFCKLQTIHLRRLFHFWILEKNFAKCLSDLLLQNSRIAIRCENLPDGFLFRAFEAKVPLDHLTFSSIIACVSNNKTKQYIFEENPRCITFMKSLKSNSIEENQLSQLSDVDLEKKQSNLIACICGLVEDGEWRALDWLRDQYQISFRTLFIASSNAGMVKEAKKWFQKKRALLMEALGQLISRLSHCVLEDAPDELESKARRVRDFVEKSVGLKIPRWMDEVLEKAEEIFY